MATRNIPSDLIRTDRAVIAASGDIVNVGPLATVGATNGTAVFSTGSDVTVNIRGEAIGEVGIELGDNPTVDSSHLVNVLASGSVFGLNAVNLAGTGSSVVNDGDITGILTAVSIIGSGTGSTATIVNRGLMAAQTATVQILSTNEATNIRNDGRILNLKDGGVAIFVSGSSNGPVTLVNYGLIDGIVDLGSGNDRYFGLTGRVTGVIFGDAGNDRFALGTGAERISGGTGIDTVLMTGAFGFRLALDNSVAGSRRAAGDTFTSVENVSGTTRADAIRGNAGANLLDGRSGNDRIDGAARADQLIGGADLDRLTGGTGNDTFLFRTAAHGGDTITDFRAVAGNNDRFRIDNAGFDPSLDEGVLDASQFRVRTSNANTAADADDRFIFRTVDATLWFDADGRGGTGPVLIADLQAGAVVTAADIFIF